MLLKANLGALSILCPLVQVAFSNGMPEEVAWSVTGSHQFSPRETRVAISFLCLKHVETIWYSVDQPSSIVVTNE